MTIPSSARRLRALLRPEILVRGLLKKFTWGSFDFRLAFEAFDRPWYALGMHDAADLARRLKLSGITVIEFGVAQGDGLVAMERIAVELRKLFGIDIHIIGFDSGEGLPSHSDYRDLPYVWRQGLYKMNVEALQCRLPTARLVLGDVAKTVPKFLESGEFDPIGFISFDLDYYSSTRAALRIFDSPQDGSYLPRVLVYFDDIMSGDQQYFSEDVGELLAIKHFNESTEPHRIRQIHGWKRSLLFEPQWADAMWMYHRFNHTRYNDYIGIGKLTSG